MPIASKNRKEIAAALADRLGPIDVKPPQDPDAKLAAFTIPGAAKLLDRTFPAVSGAVDVLVGAGILKQVSIGKRNRAYEAAEIIEAFTGLERRLGSPSGDTKSSKPSRRVPHRQS